MVERRVGHTIYGISKVHRNSSWQLRKPDITQLPTWWLLGVLFKEEEIAPGEKKWRRRSKTPCGILCQRRRGREHGDVGMMESTAFPLGLFLGNLYSEFLRAAFLRSFNNPPIL